MPYIPSVGELSSGFLSRLGLSTRLPVAPRRAAATDYYVVLQYHPGEDIYLAGGPYPSEGEASKAAQAIRTKLGAGAGNDLQVRVMIESALETWRRAGNYAGTNRIPLDEATM